MWRVVGEPRVSHRRYDETVATTMLSQESTRRLVAPCWVRNSSSTCWVRNKSSTVFSTSDPDTLDPYKFIFGDVSTIVSEKATFSKLQKRAVVILPCNLLNRHALFACDSKSMSSGTMRRWSAPTSFLQHVITCARNTVSCPWIAEIGSFSSAQAPCGSS